MSVFRVNGGIINSQTLTGSLRFFKMVGPFAWTVSDGSVNLPVSVSGGETTATTYFVVGDNKPVPNSAADLAFREITKQCDVVQISLVPDPYGDTTEIHFACSASAFGWGSDEPGYSEPPADVGEDPAAAAPAMQAAVRSLGTVTVYVSVGSPDQAEPPVTDDVNMGTVTITEVPFVLN